MASGGRSWSRVTTGTAGSFSIRQHWPLSRSRRFRECCSSVARRGRVQIETPTHRPPALDGAAAAVTFIGHATFLIQTAAGNVLTDPIYSRRAGPLNLVGPRRVRRPAVAFDDLPSIDGRPPQPQPLRPLRRPHSAAAGTPLRPACDRAARERTAGARGRRPQGRGTRLVAAGPVVAGARDGDAGAALLGPESLRSQSRPLVGIRAGSGRPAHLLCRRHGARHVLSRDSGASGAARPGAAADWRLRAALVHAVGPHESGRGRGRAPRARARPRRSGCTSARSS